MSTADTANEHATKTTTTTHKDTIICESIEKNVAQPNDCVDSNIEMENDVVDSMANLKLGELNNHSAASHTDFFSSSGDNEDKNNGNNKIFDPMKEMLYATPLRKSDRPMKTKEDAKSIVNKSDDLNGVAEDRHILNFLKDTTKLQKKLQRGCSGSGNNSSGDSEYGKANFSSLAQEQHFVNLVQQNVIGYSEHVAHETDSATTDEELLKIKDSANDVIAKMGAANGFEPNLIDSPMTDVCIKREWIIKLIALCLEQRTAKPSNKLPTMVLGDEAVGDVSAHKKPTSSRAQQKQSHYTGVMLLGSNGSGKTSICERIINGNSGTQGMLQRKLLCSYFINIQNAECHSLSTFIRCVVMQILSHSTFLSSKEDGDQSANQSKTSNEINISSDTSTAILETTLMDTTSLVKEIKKKTEQSLASKETIADEKSTTTKNPFLRQKSETSEKDAKNCNRSSIYDTYPPTQRAAETNPTESNQCMTPNKTKTTRGSSKIPVKIGNKTNSPLAGQHKENTPNDQLSPSKKHDADEQIAIKIVEDGEKADDNVIEYENIEIHKKSAEKPKIEQQQQKQETQSDKKPENIVDCEQPQPPPKTKSCLQMIADEYFTILLQTPEILECLNPDNIEKNPDDCFKKAILYPFLELQPPKSALLFLVDSIDEHYINEEENVMTTLKSNSTNRSRTIAELLSSNFHLMPKWIFLVCTAKRQNRHIVKKFTGFKKIALDDLRKSHVVKDVQEYIIARLNSDFKGQIQFSTDIIDCLNQLYIKSNGSILYLEKVLSGIRENVFSFREIKLIPCTLNGLYLYICQKSFNKKHYSKIRPILNILLASSDFVDLTFVLNCLRTINYTVDQAEFDKRIAMMKYVLSFNEDKSKVKIFHNSFSDWLSDVKFSTKKFLCNVNEGHAMISMYYTLVSDTLCPNQVLKYFGHLIKCDEFAKAKSINLDLILILLESKANLVDCFYTNALNCCAFCENEYKNTYCIMPRMRLIVERYLNKTLSDEILDFIGDIYKPSLPTNTKILKLLIETGINNADCQFSYDSLINSPITEDNNDELAKLLLHSEKSCQRNNSKDLEAEEANEYQEIRSPHGSPTHHKDFQENGESSDDLVHKHQLLSSGKALIHLLANEGNLALLKRALNACKKDGHGYATIDLEIEDECGQTALNIAARNGHYDIVELLLSLRYVFSATNQVKKVDVNHADRDGW